MGANRIPVKERIQKHSTENAAGCWLWTGGMSGNGYGKFIYTDRRQTVAHRASFEAFREPIPEGLELDHLCGTRSCVNPWHLEPVTHRENQRRAKSKQTHCKREHKLEGDNLYICPRGKRECRTCRRDAVRRHKERS